MGTKVEAYSKIVSFLLRNGWYEPADAEEKDYLLSLEAAGAVAKVGRVYAVKSPRLLAKIAQGLGVVASPSNPVLVAGELLPTLIKWGRLRLDASNPLFVLSSPLNDFLNDVKKSKDLFRAFMVLHDTGVRILETAEATYEVAVVGWSEEAVRDVLARLDNSFERIEDLEVARGYLRSKWRAEKEVYVEPGVSGFKYGASIYLRKAR